MLKMDTTPTGDYIMYRTLFVPALNDRALRPSLKAALPVARTFHAHILALHVIEPIVPQQPSEMAMSADLIAGQEEAMNEIAEELGRIFLEFCGDERIDIIEPHEMPASAQPTASWAQTRGLAEERAASFARQSDLVVMARRPGGNSFGGAFEEAMVARTGRPVLIAPEEPALTLPAHPVIAWNGSREAARAMAFAEPFLAHAKEVTVLTVGELPTALPSALDMVASLKRKGIKAKPEIREHHGNGSIREAIETAVSSCGGDMMVMGAYSHSRWRETILGGVTKDILKSSNIPVLLAH